MIRMLLNGDCAEKMRDLAPNSIDAIVTDPPYGLAFMGVKWDNFGGKSCGNDSAEVRRQKAEEYAAKNAGAPRYANGHGGAPTLDSMRSFQSAMTPIFAEALRVAKPGAHLLAFGGSRTYHRLACAIEDAGWEIRDCIMWVYGSGFPKSMDVAKAIDKASGYEGEVIGSRIVDVGMQGGNMHAGRKQQQQQQQIRALSPEAVEWQGWGTCLKPAVEPIVVARKPLESTVAANVLKYGTGAINIDACRVPTEGKEDLNGGAYRCKETHNRDDGWGMKRGGGGTYHQPLGRFPANLIHDGSDEVLACFPSSDKTAKLSVNSIRDGEPSADRRYTAEGSTNFAMKPGMRRPAEDTPARFFYCAKASRSERGEGNVHPTVKPLALMRYLVRLVSRKGGTVLDPFMGSGTTGVAAIQEGMNFIGIERDPHYYEIASRRISEAKPLSQTTQPELPLQPISPTQEP